MFENLEGISAINRVAENLKSTLSSSGLTKMKFM